MSIAWNRILPVVVSIGVIISIAVLRNYSKSFAAIAAVMPINIPLGLWIVYSGAEVDQRQSALQDFSYSLLVNIFPTVAYILVVWMLARAGYDLVPVILIGYAVWAVGIAIVWILTH